MEDSSDDFSQEQEGIVSRFASLMGTKSYPSDGNQVEPSSSAREKELLSCFSSSLSDDAVVCTIPSLDMRLSEDGQNPLPEVGQHMETDGPNSGLHPVMEASVLSSAADATADAAKLEQKAAQRLCTITSWTKSSIIYAANALCKNVLNSFSSLVASRIRSWTLLMFRHSLSSGDASSRSRLLSMLAAAVKIKSSSSSFKTLPLPPNAAGQTKEADVILPLIVEVVLEIALQDRTDTVTLRAPGTISGFFDTENPKGLTKVDIRLDSGALLGSMIDQARLCVFKSVANVTATDTKIGASKETGDPNVTRTPSASLSGFSSSLRLSSAAASSSPGLEKARSSALRLNSVLQGKTGQKQSAAGIRKQRSVQWENPMELPSIKSSLSPVQKRPRVSQTSTHLKSFKSFGRPHAEDTAGGPRNATFGDFGRGPIWGRDGKLANHPQPQNSLERSRGDLFGVKITGGANATFGSPSSSLSSGSTRNNSNLSSGSTRNNSNNNGNLASVPSSLPRTATALENWLMNAARGGK